MFFVVTLSPRPRSAIDPVRSARMNARIYMSAPAPRLDDLRIERSDKPDSPRRLAPLAIFLFVLVVVAAALWWFKRPAAIEVRTATARELSTDTGTRLARA